MTYDDYATREWLVVPPTDDDAKCKHNDIVTFTGRPEEVIVNCKSDGESRRPYPPGQYIPPPSNTIGRENEYEIHMIEVEPGQKPQIRFTPMGSFAGSWTAEDNGPWPGEG